MSKMPGAFSRLSVRLPALFLAAAALPAVAIGWVAQRAAVPLLGAAGLPAERIEPAIAALSDAVLPVFLGLLGLAAACGWLVARSIARPVLALQDGLGLLAKGEGLAGAASARGDEIGDLARALEDVRESGVEAARIRAALDGCRTNIMVCDAKSRVVYVNKSLLKFFTEAQDDFRIAFPGISAKDMLGKVMEVFDRQSEGGSRTMRLELGRRTLSLSVTPMLHADGSRLGATMEWRELTEELRAAGEVAAVVAAAARGDFSQRIPLAGKPEVLAQIADGVNQLNGIVDEAVGEFAGVVSGLAAGDLTRRTQGAYQGRLAALSEGLNETLALLADTVSGIQESSDHVAATAAEIRGGAADLAVRTEDTAGDLEETAATTELLSDSVKRSAARARAATELAGETMGVAGSGQKVMTEAVGAIERIEDSSSRIAEIVTVIDEIAFQTNLLALNAAVEAARAGDAGKGFAVVASEVRTLAQRSAQAAKDIRGLIAGSRAQVADGVRLVRDTGAALGRIVTAAGEVSAMVSEISAASSEQAHGIAALSQNVLHMDATTQQNAILAEQSAGAAEDLAAQIEALRSLVGFFRTGQQAPRRDVPAALRPRLPAKAVPVSPRRAEIQPVEPRPFQLRRRSGGRADERAEF